ncbi:MAG: tetratricopeptide repeat protein, partial [Candidatus Acidiferrales bacterium]
PTSCSPQAQATITKGVALLHSFQYMQSEQTFADAAKQDPQCAMAQWGKATALYEQLWYFPAPGTIAEARGYLEQVQKLGAPTAREREYIAAAAVLYQDDPKLSHRERAQTYSAALEKLYRDFPNDVDAGAFYALSLLTLAKPGDADLPDREKAIAILNPLLKEHPEHPGVAHYLIHAADTPELAPQGLEAARRYARIAPDSSHALHMPAHIFNRLGLWQESIDSNLSAAAAAAKAGEMHMSESHYETHALDFLDYAYLQTGQESKARHLVEEVKNVPGISEEDLADFQSIFAARNALELHRWKEAAGLPVPTIRLTWQDTTYWARAIGAARIGDVEGARKATEKLREIVASREESEKRKGNEVPAGKPVDLREAEAWLAFAEGKSDEALKIMRGAAERQETERIEGLAIPAREMMADMLVELRRPADALVEYKAALKESPNRFDALYGAARAANFAGNAAESREFFAKLVEISNPTADRPELREARVSIARK